MQSTQIGGGGMRNMAKVIAFKEMLESFAVKVAHPDVNEFSFFEAGQSGWRAYESELAFFESIGGSSFHLVCNDTPIDAKLAQQMLYAMLKRRPLVVSDEPVFAEDVSTFAQRTIRGHLAQMYVMDFTKMRVAEVKQFLSMLPESVNYHLSPHETMMINVHGKGHFRDLIEHARGAHGQRRGHGNNRLVAAPTASANA